MQNEKRAYKKLKFLTQFSMIAACLWLMVGIFISDLLPDMLSLPQIFMLSLLILLLAGLVRFRLHGGGFHFILSAMAMLLLGVCLSHFQIMRQGHNVLSEPVRERFLATIIDTEYRGEGGARFLARLSDPPATLQQIGLVRLSIRQGPPLEIGSQYHIHAQLFPLSGPFLPGLPDYGRSAYLQGIGASGFVYDMALYQDAAPKRALTQQINHLRQNLATSLLLAVKAPANSIMAALYLGRRDLLPDEVYTYFQRSGLAHLLAISGLHMAVFCFSVYSIIRISLLPVSRRLWLSPHKLSAILAMSAGFGYLMIAGMPVSAVRAWGMAVLILLAIITDRQALTLRTLALIGIGILSWQPALLYQPAFQLSFMATFSIIASLALVKDRVNAGKISGRIFRLVITSLAAGLSTAPFIAYHFATFTPWSLVANVLAIPLMGVLMPIGAVGLIFWQMTGFDFGLLSVIETGLHLLVGIARFFSHLPAAGIWILPPPPICLPLWALSVIGLLSAQSRHVIAGLILLLGFSFIWLQHRPADLYHIETGGRMITIVNGDEALYANAPLSPFWQSVLQKQTGPKPIETCKEEICIFQLRGKPVAFIAGRSGLTAACRPAEIDTDVVRISPFRPRYPCAQSDKMLLTDTDGQGGEMITLTTDGRRIAARARISQRERPWRAP